VHREGAWKLVVDDREIPLPGDASSPEWANDSVVTTVTRAGFAELVRDGEQITVSRGGAFDPAPSPDGRIFFMSLEPDGYVVRVLQADSPVPVPAPVPVPDLVPAIPPQPTHPAEFTSTPVTQHAYGFGRQELSWFASENVARGQRSMEVGVRIGDVVGRLDSLLVASIANGAMPQGVALASAWRGWPIELHAHAFHTEDDDGVEVRGHWTRYRWTIDGGGGARVPEFLTTSYSPRQVFGAWRLEESLRIDVENDGHQRGVLEAALASPSLRLAARVQHDRGDGLVLGGLASSILPRSAYARRVLDPALPVATLAGTDYDGWRIETRLPSMPFTAFYQHHEIGDRSLSLYGLKADLHTDPMPILKVPALDFTAGVARVEEHTNWWFGMRWRP
jgi:hypothetical protein